MHTPLVSIIIPAFNSENWICDTIASAVDQDWPNTEIIVIDDGSTDSTLHRAREFEVNSRVQVVKQTNAGASAARNHGLRIAKGPYIQFLDADDLLSSSKISTQMKTLLSSNKNRLASCAWSSFSENPDEAQVIPQPVWRIEDPCHWLTTSLSGGGMMQTACWLTDRELLDHAGPWNEDLSLHDDGEYFCRILLAAKKQIYVDGPTVKYRTVTNSLSRQRSRKAIQSAYQVCVLRDKHLLKTHNNSNTRKAIATQYGQFAYEFSATADDLTTLAMRRIDELETSPSRVIGNTKFLSLIHI